MNVSKWVAVILVTLRTSASMFADTYSVDMAIARRTILLDVESNLSILMSRIDKESQAQFVITNCVYIVSQNLKDSKIELDVDLPASIHLEGAEGGLSQIYAKSIDYEVVGEELLLKNDDTDGNLVAGSISSWLSLLVSPASKWPSSLAGMPITTEAPYEQLLVETPYRLVSRKLFDLSDVYSVTETSIVNSLTGEKGFSRIIALIGNEEVFQRVDCAIMNHKFMKLVSDSLKEKAGVQSSTK